MPDSELLKQSYLCLCVCSCALICMHVFVGLTCVDVHVYMEDKYPQVLFLGC